MLTISFIYPFFYLSNQIFYYRFLGFYESQSLQISCTSWEWPSQVYCGTGNQDVEIYFYCLFPFLLFSISHSNVIHREICVKDFSGITVPRILKFGTNVGYALLYCVKENQHAAIYYSLYLSIFLSLQNVFVTEFSACITEFSYIYSLRGAKYIVRKKILWRYCD